MKPLLVRLPEEGIIHKTALLQALASLPRGWRLQMVLLPVEQMQDLLRYQGDIAVNLRGPCHVVSDTDLGSFIVLSCPEGRFMLCSGPERDNAGLLTLVAAAAAVFGAVTSILSLVF